MNRGSRLQQILDRVIDKTRAGELTWNKAVYPADAYVTSLPYHSIQIARDEQGLKLSFYDERGQVFAEERSTGPVVTSPGGPVIGQKFLDLYNLAQSATYPELEFEKLLMELR